MPRHYKDPDLHYRRGLLEAQLRDLEDLLAQPTATHECLNLVGVNGRLLIFDCSIAPTRRASLVEVTHRIVSELEG